MRAHLDVAVCAAACIAAAFLQGCGEHGTPEIATPSKGKTMTIKKNVGIEIFPGPDNYMHMAMSCINGHTIVLHAKTSLKTCATLCDNEPKCAAFEFGVNYGGEDRSFNRKDCRLISAYTTKDFNQCLGEYENKDLYVKGDLEVDEVDHTDPTPNNWTRLKMSCVTGHNMASFHNKTVAECAKLCDANPKCPAFEYGVEYSGAGHTTKAKDCRLQDASDYAGCPGAFDNLDLYIKGKVEVPVLESESEDHEVEDPPSNWTRLAMACVKGNDLITYSGKSVTECARLCDAEPKCPAFEYGMDYGGTAAPSKKNDCRLQTLSDYKGCKGADNNLDLYIRGEVKEDENRFDAEDDDGAAPMEEVDPDAVKNEEEPPDEVEQTGSGNFTHLEMTCIKGHTLAVYKMKTVEECAALCKAEHKCVSFSYGVDADGPGMDYEPMDCQLQDSTETAGCSGQYDNLDLYVREGIDILEQGQAASLRGIAVSMSFVLAIASLWLARKGYRSFTRKGAAQATRAETSAKSIGKVAASDVP